MTRLLQRVLHLLAVGVYFLTLVDVSTRFTEIPVAVSAAAAVACCAALIGLSRLSSLRQSRISIVLLLGTLLAIACRLGGYEPVVHRTEREWQAIRHRMALDIAERVSARFMGQGRRALLTARQLARDPALSQVAQDPESRELLRRAFHVLDRSTFPRPLPPAQPGATLYDRWHEPLAWTGKNVDLEPYFQLEEQPSAPSVFVLEKGVFTYLVAIQPLAESAGHVAVEIPLTARRSLNNRYLTDYDVVRSWAGKGLTTDWVDVREKAPEVAGLFYDSGDRYWGGTPDAPTLYFPLRSPLDEVLAVCSLAAEDPSTALLEHRRSTARVAGALLAAAALAVVILLGLSLWGHARLGRGWTPVLTRTAAFGLALLVLRVVLLWANIPLGLGSGADNPAYYASSLFFDFFRSPVDLLLTALTTLLIVCALVFPWTRESTFRPSHPRGLLTCLILRSVSAAAVLCLLIGVNRLVEDTWSNSNLPLALPSFAPPQGPLLAVQLGLLLFFLAAGMACGFLFSAVERAVGASDAVPLQGIVQIWALDLLVFTGAGLLLGSEGSAGGLLPSLAPLLAFHLLVLRRRSLREHLVTPRPHRRWATYVLLFLVPAVTFYPSVAFYEDRTTRQFIESTVAPAVLHHGGSQYYVLVETLEAIDRMERAGRVSAPENTDLAYRIWSASDLSVTALSSSIEIFDEQGRMVSRFALNFPSVDWSSEPEGSMEGESIAGGDWVYWQDPYPGQPNRPRILNARRVFQTKEGAYMDVRVRLVADWSNLPFLTTQNPYIDLFRSQGTEAPLPLPHGELSLYVFDHDGNLVFRSAKPVLTVDPDTALEARKKAFWTDRTLGGQPYHVTFFSDPQYVFGLTYLRKSARAYGAELVGWALFSGLAALVLLFLGAVVDFIAGWHFLPTRGLWAELGRSFYGKLFISFTLLALVPTVLLALLARGVVVQQLERDVEQEGIARAGFVKQFVSDYLTFQTMDASERGVAAVDDAFLEYVGSLVDSDVDLYSRGELVATSKRELFASGLLPKRAVPKVFTELVLQRATHSIHRESVGSFHYLVVSVPIALERWGEPGILSIPLASRQREIDRQVASLNQLVLLAAICFALVAAALAYALARRIAEPINTLTEATRRVAQGDFDVMLRAQSDDEIGALSKSFNQMISDLKRQRQDLERTKKLEAWAEMARQVAHEVKNPLTPIQLSAEHLLRVFDDQRVDFRKVLKDCAETILQQVRTLRHISMEFSTFANPSPIEPEPTDLTKLVAETVEPYRQAPPEGVEIHLDLASGTPSLLLDRRLIQRTLINLLENAFHALNGHGRVDVRVRPTDKRGRRWVEVEVSDTGEGIEAGLQERIFEPYFSTRVSGTGLGLAIARKAVEEHGGTIELESESGRGTKVRITLPVADPSDPE